MGSFFGKAVVTIIFLCFLGSTISRVEAATYVGTLGPSDSRLIRKRYVDGYKFEPAESAEPYVIEVRSYEFDTYLAVVSPEGEVLINDDYKKSTNRSLIQIPPDAKGSWTVLVTSYRINKGIYSLSVLPCGTLAKQRSWELDSEQLAKIFNRLKAITVAPVRIMSTPEEDIPLAVATDKVKGWFWTKWFRRDSTDTTAAPAPDDSALFPWPPPHASATKVLSRHLVVGNTTSKVTLAHIDTRLCSALQAVGYHDKTYYSVPDGFALVTRLEQISADGTPLDASVRWAIEIPPLKGFSLRDYIKALFGARVGYYRLLVFIVTPHPFVQIDKEIRLHTAIDWLHRGTNIIPESMAIKPYTQRHQTTALVYEFKKIRASSITDVIVPGLLDGENHLRRSGILSELEK